MVLLNFFNEWNKEMIKIVSLICVLTLFGCASTHNNEIQEVDCIGIYLLGIFPYEQKVKLKIVQKRIDRFGHITYKAGANLGVHFMGRGLIKESEIQIVECK